MKSVKRMLASTLVILLAASPLAPAAQGPQVLSLAHSPVGCMIAGTNPQLEAGLNPGDQVLAGRVFFRSALGDSFYYVEMTPMGEHYVGVLPRPRLDAGPITYYIEGIARNYAQSQSPEQRAVVVEKAGDCGDKPLAALGPSAPVRVFSVVGTAVPSGFTGVSSVVAAGTGGAAAAGAGAAAAGGSFFTSNAGIIVISAVAVGVATVIFVNHDNPPASPSQ